MPRAAKGDDQLVEQAIIDIQEGEDEIADHHPRQEVGEEHHRLVYLGLALGVQLVDHQRQRHRNDDAQDDKDDVVQQRIAQQHGEGLVGEEELEVLKPHKVAVQQII